VPQSRHRKSTKAKKRAKGPYSNPSPRTSPGKNRNLRIGAIAVVAVLAVSAVAYVITHRGKEGPEIVTASGLKYVDLVQGDGPSPQPGQTVSVNYVGTLTNGKKFDSSYDHGRPFDFRIGTGSVIKGWDEGVMSMKVGGKRKLIVPPALGYGVRGNPPDIPGNSTLVFEIELLSVK
jgi:FKBP-type peptidyl-prolyl cis-trans isomerase